MGNMKLSMKPTVNVQLALEKDLVALAARQNAQVFEYCQPQGKWLLFVASGMVFGCYVA